MLQLSNIFMYFNSAFAEITYLPHQLMAEVKVLFLYHSAHSGGYKRSCLGMPAGIWNCMGVES